MCNCNYQRVNATSVATASGVTTITVPATVTFDDGTLYDIGLFTNIPTGVNCTQIVITNGTATATIMNHSANYFRPCCLFCRSIISARYLADPSHFIINRIKR